MNAKANRQIPTTASQQGPRHRSMRICARKRLKRSRGIPLVLSVVVLLAGMLLLLLRHSLTVVAFSSATKFQLRPHSTSCAICARTTTRIRSTTTSTSRPYPSLILMAVSNRRPCRRLPLYQAASSLPSHDESFSSSTSSSNNDTAIDTAIVSKCTASVAIDNSSSFTANITAVTINGEHDDSKSRSLVVPTESNSKTPASSVSSSLVPSYTQLLIFVAGTVAIWLSEPLLSLVDTTVVGMSASATATTLSSVLPLAAMGPATVLNDISLYSTYFLALATTSQLTAACHSQRWRDCQRLTSHLMGVALVTGLLVSILLWTLGPSILTGMICGSSSTTAAATATATITPAAAEMTRLAIQYCRIRALAAPAAVLNMVAQAVCLATVDVTTPVLAVVTASVVNVIGDVYWRHHRLAGVATATALATLASCTVLVTAVVSKLKRWRANELRQEENALYNDNRINGQTTSSLQAANGTAAIVETETTIPATVGNTGTTKAVPWLSLPQRYELWQLIRLSLPLAFNMWTKMACYFALTWKATEFGATCMASHNILMRIFFFFGCFGDALSQTAQSFLPATLYPTKRTIDFERICRRIGVVAVGVAAFNYGASRAILCSGGRLFTNDGGILQCLRATSIWTAWTLALHPLVVSISGTVIATRNFANLVKVYAVTAVVHFALLSRATSFANVWQTLVVFQMVRLLNYLFWTTVTPAKASLSTPTP